MDHRHTLLIIEDDVDCRRGLDVSLRKSGHRILHAADARTGLATARQERPAVILLDLGLPDGDGLGVLEQVLSRPETKDCAVIVVSARDMQSHRSRALDLGARAYVEKPYDMDELREIIDRSLATTKIAAHAEPEESAPLKVLVVEDDPDTLRAMSIILRRRGVDVAIARDAVTAVSIARAEQPDAILLDLGLPGCADTKLVERFRLLDSLFSTPIIVITGKSAVEHRDSALAAGADAFIEKPAEEDEIFAALEAALVARGPVGAP